MSSLPASADIVVVGGGVFGCAIAWRLAADGRSVLLLERNGIASGASARAAGLITPLRPNPASIWLVGRTLATMDQFEAAGESPGFHQVGTLLVAASAEREAQLTDMVALAAGAGVHCEDLTRDEARLLLPWLSLEQARRIVLAPGGGFVDPHLLTQAYARAARAAGASLLTGVHVTGIEMSGARVAGIVTSAGTVSCSEVMVAGGAWSLPLLSALGISLGMAPVRSHYWITEREAVFDAGQPVVLLPDAGTYTRPELGGLVIGAREDAAPTFDARGLPADAGDAAIATDEDQWTGLLERHDALKAFVPALDEWRMAHFIAGLSTYTADGKHILGPAPGITGLWVATGCCGTGISVSAGIAELMADLVAGRTPAIDPAPYRLDRFGSVDPYDPAFRARCAASRTEKSRLTVR